MNFFLFCFYFIRGAGAVADVAGIHQVLLLLYGKFIFFALYSRFFIYLQYLRFYYFTLDCSFNHHSIYTPLSAATAAAGIVIITTTTAMATST